MKKIRLIDIWPDWTAKGIFYYLEQIAGGALPWSVSSSLLDMEYLGTHSGGKPVSPLIYRLLMKDETEELSDERLLSLARIVWNRYGEQWRKLYAVFALQYDPIENYSMTEREESSGTNTGTVGESENVSGTNTGTQSNTYSKQGSNTGTVADSETIGRTLQRDTESNTDTEATGSIYGYDSSTPAPSDKQVSSADTTGGETVDEDTTRSNTRTDNLANTESGTDTRTDNLAHAEQRTGTRTDNLAHEDERTLTRSGNIGTVTAQDMITQEIELWQYDFFAVVYANIDKVLTIPIY